MNERIQVRNYEDQALEAKLKHMQADVDAEMKTLFGVTLDHARQNCAPNSPLDYNLVTQLLSTTLRVMRSQQRLLDSSGKVTEAAEMDIRKDNSSALLITDLERALEFVSEESPRKSPESFIRVWEKFVQDARESLDTLSPTPQNKPPILLPNGLRTPITGMNARFNWEQQRDLLNKKTEERIKQVDSFVRNIWLSNLIHQ